MKTVKTILAALLILPFVASAQPNIDTLSVGKWMKIPTSGTYPGYGVETHLAHDTSGNFYMLGACAYYGDAGGTHNNDIFRFQTRTGVTALPYSCGNNPWPGGCQGGQVFDRNRNCIWFGPGANATCRTNGVVWFPNQAYYGGLYRMWCPSGPLEKIQDNALGGGYYLFDPVNDLVIGVAHNNYFGCKLSIYDVNAKTTYTTTSPWNPETYTWRIPCCFDTKRGLVVITRWSNNGSNITDVWLYNTSTRQWSRKTPTGSVPPHVNMPLVYEPVADKYVLIGSTGTPFVWAYDPITNAWTNHSGGSGPPLRVYPGSFGYCEKTGVIANWGGLPTNGGGDEGSIQPIWVYKFSEKPTTSVSKQVLRKEIALSVFPNPFRTSVTLTLPQDLRQGALVRVHDLAGRRVADLTERVRNGKVIWNAAALPPAVYMVTAEKAGRSYSRKVLLVK
jgi:hypothetical protein